MNLPDVTCSLVSLTLFIANCSVFHLYRYEGAFNRFVDEINLLATYQWWEGSIYSILGVSAYPLAWSWLQWRRRLKLQRLREFVRSEYDHACLRSCRSRALYDGIKVFFFLFQKNGLGFIEVYSCLFCYSSRKA